MLHPYKDLKIFQLSNLIDDELDIYISINKRSTALDWFVVVQIWWCTRIISHLTCSLLLSNYFTFAPLHVTFTYFVSLFLTTNQFSTYSRILSGSLVPSLYMLVASGLLFCCFACRCICLIGWFIFSIFFKRSTWDNKPLGISSCSGFGSTHFWQQNINEVTAYFSFSFFCCFFFLFNLIFLIFIYCLTLKCFILSRWFQNFGPSIGVIRFYCSAACVAIWGLLGGGAHCSFLVAFAFKVERGKREVKKIITKHEHTLFLVPTF